MSINEKNIYYATITSRNCVSVILSGLCSMNLYQSPKLFTLMIWYCRATAIKICMVIELHTEIARGFQIEETDFMKELSSF